jgi:hypothetical protein
MVDTRQQRLRITKSLVVKVGKLLLIMYYRIEKLSLDFKLIATKNRDLDLNNTNNKFISAQC